MIRLARSQDLNGIEELYDHIHDLEEAGGQAIGWIRGVYPVRATAEEALARGDLFVMVINEPDPAGEVQPQIVGAAFINQLQVDVYDQANWRYPARDDEVMVMHTLVIDPAVQHRGLGRVFLKYYEDYAAERIQRKRELLEEERRKKEPNEFTIRRLEADIWVLQNS